MKLSLYLSEEVFKKYEFTSMEDLLKRMGVSDEKEPKDVAFWKACENRVYDAVEYLLKSGVDPDCSGMRFNGINKTNLMVACDKSEIDLVRILLKYKADVNRKNSVGMTPLMYAVSSSSFRIPAIDKDGHTIEFGITKMLLDAGAKINVRNSWGESPVSMIINSINNISQEEYGMKECVNGKHKLLDLLEKYTRKKKLSEAKIFKPFEPKNVQEILARFGTDDLDQALVSACRNENYTVMKVLLNAGAKTDKAIDMLNDCIEEAKSDVDGFAERNGSRWSDKEQKELDSYYDEIDMYEKMIKFLEDNRINENEIFKPFDPKTKEDILDRYELTRDTSLNQALMIACSKGHKEVAEKLIDMGAEVNHLSRNGYQPPIFKAILHFPSYPNLVQMLIDKGADVNIQNALGDTPLMLANFHNKIEVMDMLIDAGAKANVENQNGMTALMYAVKENNLEGIYRLIKHGKAEVLYENKKGQTVFDFVRDDYTQNYLRTFLDKDHPGRIGVSDLRLSPGDISEAQIFKPFNPNELKTTEDVIKRLGAKSKDDALLMALNRGKFELSKILLKDKEGLSKNINYANSVFGFTITRYWNWPQNFIKYLKPLKMLLDNGLKFSVAGEGREGRPENFVIERLIRFIKEKWNGTWEHIEEFMEETEKLINNT